MSQTFFTLNLCRFFKSFYFLAVLFLLSFSNVWTEELSSFEKRELSRLLEMDWNELANQPVFGVLGYDQEHWRNPASIAVIRPDDVFNGGHLQLVDSFRGECL